MKIFLFARDPGGANTIIPLINPLFAIGHDLYVYGKDAALKKFDEAQIQATDITRGMSEINIPSLRTLIHDLSPDIVITGTSADDNTEKYLWKACEKAGIPSLAIIDQWCNYGIRFSDFGIDRIDQYKKRGEHPWLPSIIATLDDYARQEMIEQGLPEKIIRVTGQPYFAILSSYLKKRKHFSEIGDKNKYTLVFASEPISKTYGPNALLTKGYSEHSIFDSFLNALDGVVNMTASTVKLIIRPHPKEKKYILTHHLKKYSKIEWEIDATAPGWEIIEKADLVCGMSSMFLIEAVILGKPILSIQIGLTAEDPFILSRRGIIPSILTEQSLRDRLLQFFNNKNSFEHPDFEVIDNPVERIIGIAEELACPS